MTNDVETKGGFYHRPSDEQLRAYLQLTAEQKLAWLHAAWKMTVDFLPKDRLELYQKMRAGKI